MVVDTSAVVAILSREPGGGWLADALGRAEQRLMAAPTYVELGMVVESRYGLAATGAAARFVRDAEIDVLPIAAQAAERALEAWRRFGKGRHAAKLNFGDCLVYGLAAERRLPILCIGEDFARTDIQVLRPPANSAAPA